MRRVGRMSWQTLFGGTAKIQSQQTKFENMNLPDEVKAILTDFAEQKFGVYNPPYEHQAELVEAVFNDEKDVIVVTGTGSGKLKFSLIQY